MPRLSCWFIRAALLHLAIGVVFGGLILSAKGFPTAIGWAWLLLPARLLLVSGGMLEIVGVLLFGTLIGDILCLRLPAR